MVGKLKGPQRCGPFCIWLNKIDDAGTRCEAASVIDPGQFSSTEQVPVEKSGIRSTRPCADDRDLSGSVEGEPSTVRGSVTQTLLFVN